MPIVSNDLGHLFSETAADLIMSQGFPSFFCVLLMFLIKHIFTHAHIENNGRKAKKKKKGVNVYDIER